VRVCGAVLILMMLSASSVLSAPSGDIIRVLAIGEVDTAYCPIYGFCASEPSLDVTLAVARDMHGTNYGDKGLQRIIRLYVPRNLDAMLGYDFIVINQPVIRFFPQSSLEAMYSAVAEHGVGSLCFMESKYREIYEPWLQTRLSQCYPYDHYKNIRMGAPGGQPYNLEVVMDQQLPPLLRPFVPLGIEKIRPFGYARPTFPREGATEWAYCKTDYWSYKGITKFPLFLSWHYGEANAMVWTTADQFDSPFWRATDGKERFELDIFTGIIWLSCGWRLPEDPLMVHQLRSAFTQANARISSSYAMLDFIDSFGANTRRLEQELAGVQDMKQKAARLYLSNKFSEASSAIAETMSALDKIDSESVSLRRRAMMWVHLVEWLTITSSLAITGSLLWTLMVRRRLFKPVSSTRGLE